MKQNTARSYLMFIGSMLIFGTIGIFRRYIPLSSALLACTRGIIGALFLAVFVRLKGGKIFHGIGVRKTLLLILSGAAIGANWIFLFEAYNHTTVAVATLCYYMQPPIVILLSPLVFRERLTIKKILCITAAVIGMIFVSGVITGTVPSRENGLGILLGLTAAVLYSFAVILNKKLQDIDAFEKTILQLGTAAAAVLPYLLLTEDFSSITFTPKSIIMLAIVGIVHTGAAYALYFAGIDALDAQSGAILSYIDPVTALILSALLLGETMSGYSVIGAVLIIGAAMVSELKLPRKKSDNSAIQ